MEQTSHSDISVDAVDACMLLSLFTRLLSRNACGVEYPLTLRSTQRNDSAWYTTLGNGEEKTKARARGEEQKKAMEET